MKKRKLTIPLAVIAAAVIAFAIVVATRPEDFRVTRSATIAAPVPVVFAQVNDFRKWEAWSPWAKLDPKARNTFGETTTGKGASLAWAGNNKVGEGRMVIAESRPNEFIRIDLEFLKPFKASNVSEFSFTPEGNQTLVTWSMSGKNNFISKAIGLFMDCEKMVGGQFEQGLSNIKSIAESAPKGNTPTAPST